MAAMKKPGVAKTKPEEKKAAPKDLTSLLTMAVFAIGNVMEKVTELIPVAQRYMETGILAHEAAIKWYATPAPVPFAPPALTSKKGQMTLDEAKGPTVAAKDAESESMGGAPKTTKLRVLQDRLVKVIDDHEETLRPSLDELGCGGDCYKCPNPEAEKYHGVEAQVRGCLTSVVGALKLDPALLR